MLTEILGTRIMVKAAMKRWAVAGPRPAAVAQKEMGAGAGAGAAGVCPPTAPALPARVLQRILDSRQFGLKMISNVTYGYTSASFSGRMPFAELADTIVQSGRCPVCMCCFHSIV